MSLNDWLSRRRLYTPHRVAIVDDNDGHHFTYAELDDRATHLAWRLQEEFSLAAGERLACLSKNRMEVIDLYFACAKIGVVLVPLNFRLPEPAILELLQDCQPSLLAFEADFFQIAMAVQQAQVVPRTMPLEPNKDDHGSVARPVVTYPAKEDDLAMLLYTSGTTGRAKGAMITWRQIHWNVLNTTIGLQLSENDVAFLNMPLYHTGAWHVLFTPLMLLGGRVILQPRFDADRCNLRAGPEGVTILFGVPTMLRMMWESPGFAAADFASVRFAICGGEPCPLPVIDAYKERGIAIRQGYGLTEAGPNCFSLPAEDAVRKQGSIGFPNFFVQTRLVRDDDHEAEVEEVGELWMKGPHVFGGYWGNTTETSRKLRDGWVGTGDLMTRDADGYFYVVGRKQEMYISGGENVYPAQVERALQQHEAVSLAAVVGVPDEKWGETGWAFCQLQPDHVASESELVAWCQQQLAKFQCPTKVVIMAELPTGHSGKIDKLALRKLAESESAAL